MYKNFTLSYLIAFRIWAILNSYTVLASTASLSLFQLSTNLAFKKFTSEAAYWFPKHLISTYIIGGMFLVGFKSGVSSHFKTNWRNFCQSGRVLKDIIIVMLKKTIIFKFVT